MTSKSCYVKSAKSDVISLGMWLFVALAFIGGCAAMGCEQSDSCSCTFEDGTELDLTSLGNTDNTPRFKDVQSGDGNYYSYNPCTPFQELECKDAATCVVSPDKSESVQIGDASSAGFQYSETIGHVVAAYTSGTIKDLRLSEVVLICDESACEPDIVADGRQESGEFKLTLTTVCACGNGCNSKGPINCKGGTSGLSAGSTLCIVFFSSSFLYIVIGTVVLKFVRKKEGIEIIPNVTFWQTLPILIKGGFMFLINKIRRRSNYDSI